MEFLKRIVAAVVILTFLCLTFPTMIQAKQKYWLAQETAPTKITQNAPKYVATPEQEMPEEEKGYFKWVLAGLGGLLLVGGLAAMGGGGGGGGGGGNGGGTGSVSVGW